MFVGGYFLRIIGTLLIYLRELLVALIRQKKCRSLREIWYGPYNPDFWVSVSSEMLLKGIGFLFCLFVLLLLYFYPYLFS